MIQENTIDKALKDLFGQIEFQAEPAGLYDPLRYMIAIGGKRLRPKLCLLAYGVFTETITPAALEAAAALEILHSFTLIHDDIMDRSPLRRGHETIWKKWGEDTAILSGDAMCIEAFKRIAKLPGQVLPEALALFSRTSAEVCDGQQLDMEFEHRSRVEMPEYMRMIGLKTSVLLACCAQMGALVAGADGAAQQKLYDFGYNLGLAFQVADDYLDAYGDERVFGKPIGGDILNAKKSWLTIRAEELGAKGIAEVLNAPALTQEEKTAKIARMKALYDSVGVADAARQEIKRLNNCATDALASLPEDGKQVLLRFANALTGRTF